MPDIVVKNSEDGKGVSIDVLFDNMQDANDILVRGAITAGQRTYRRLGMTFEAGYEGPELADPWTCFDVMKMEDADFNGRRIRVRNDSFMNNLLQFGAIAWLQEKILKKEEQDAWGEGDPCSDELDSPALNADHQSEIEAVLTDKHSADVVNALVATLDHDDLGFLADALAEHFDHQKSFQIA